jgi:indolepyruvate ferredoxin oxidoreductase
VNVARLGTGDARLVIGCDLVVTASGDALDKMHAQKTHALVNGTTSPTAAFVKNPDWQLPGSDLQRDIREAGGRDTEFIPAAELATALMGDSIATNMFMLGFAWQRGLLPVGREALLRAVELNGVAVADNGRAFDWGRRAAADPARAESLATAAAALPPSRRPSHDLDEAIARRRADLVAYQGEALARRYDALVERVRRAERQAGPGSERLTLAVARQLHRLFAYKDEYEVARLYSDAAFDAALDATFEGGARVHFHLALPWQRQAADGEPRKRRFGPWLRSAMRLLAQGKRLRGTPLDPFGRGAERRLERALAVEYEATVERLLLRLDADRLESAVAIAELPARIRGFGPVKRRNAQSVRERQTALLAAYEADEPVAAPMARAA